MSIVVHNGTLVDGTDRDPITRGAVLIEGSQIVAAGSEDSVQAPSDAQRVDAGGGTIIPGMVNAHDHISRKSLRLSTSSLSFREEGHRLMSEPHEYLILRSAQNVLAQLRSGITTIRDFGLAGYSGITLKRAIGEGIVPGPELQPCGHPICMTGGHVHQWSREADGPEEVRKAVREEIRAGADCIKFMASGGLVGFPEEDPGIPELTYEELALGASEARKFHKITGAHAYATEAIKNVINAGIDTVEHGVYLDEECISMMKRNGTALVPTISGLMHLPFQFRSIGREDLYEAIIERVINPQKESIRLAVEAGIPIGTGSDTAGEVVEEIELIHEASGLSNLDCIRAVTRVSNEIIGFGDTKGTIEPGKHADVVVLSGQPLEDLSQLRTPQWVIHSGVLYEGEPMPLGVRLRG